MSISPTADAVVVGGGVIGTSVAYHLARRARLRVLLVERRFLGAESSGRSSALVRTHYSHPTLIRWALEGREVFRHWRERIGAGECGFHQVGYLLIVSERDQAPLRANVAAQRAAGVEVELLSPMDLARLEPDLFVSDLAAGAFEPCSGYADPAGTTLAFAEAARAHGATIVQECEAERIEIQGGRVMAVETSRGRIATPVVVDAAGAWAARLAATAGIELPITSSKHTIGVFAQPPGLRKPAHTTVSDRITGLYIRSEVGGLTLVGASDQTEGTPDVDPDTTDDRPDPLHVQSFAERLIHRFPAMENATLRRGYAGLYHETPDNQPILGPVPAVDGLYAACGFSHGFKLSPVIGERIADCVVSGASAVPDLHAFRPERFGEGDLIRAPHPYSRAILI